MPIVRAKIWTPRSRKARVMWSAAVAVVKLARAVRPFWRRKREPCPAVARTMVSTVSAKEYPFTSAACFSGSE